LIGPRGLAGQRGPQGPKALSPLDATLEDYDAAEIVIFPLAQPNIETIRVLVILLGVVGGIVGLGAMIGGVYFDYKCGRDDGKQAAAVRRTND
jgi:hypothetical protein